MRILYRSGMVFGRRTSHVTHWRPGSSVSNCSTKRPWIPLHKLGESYFLPASLGKSVESVFGTILLVGDDVDAALLGDVLSVTGARR